MQVNGQEPPNAAGIDQVGDHARAHWFSAARATVLSSIAKVRYDGRQPDCACPAAGIGKEQEL